MINPILERELKTRMRTVKTSILLMVYLLIMSLIVTVFFLTNQNNFNPKVAVNIYHVIATAQFIILMMMLPAISAVSVSGERERQTLDLMLCTDISPWQIVFGKIFSSLSFILLIVIATLPFMGIVFLYGGVSILEILAIILYFMVSAFMVSTIGFYFSVRFKKSITAIIMTYLATSFLYVGTFIMYFITGAIASVFITDYTLAQKFLTKMANIFFVPNPFYGLITMLYDNPSMGGILYIFGGYGTTISKVTWVSNVIFALMLSGLLLLLSKNRLAKVK